MGVPTDCMNCGWPLARHLAARCPGGDEWERYEPHPLDGLPRYPLRRQKQWRERLQVLAGREASVQARYGSASPESEAAWNATESHANRKPRLLPWCWTLWRRRL